MKEETGAPFRVGQKVVCIKDKLKIIRTTAKPVIKMGDTVDVVYIYKDDNLVSGWAVEFKQHIGYVYCSKCFAPITEQYADLTAEIAASLKQTDETPDRIQVPEKLES